MFLCHGLAAKRNVHVVILFSTADEINAIFICTKTLYSVSIKDTLTSAKLARSLGTIVDLLLQCNELGTIAEQAGVVDRSIHGIVDCWLMSSKLRPRATSSSKVNDLIDPKLYEGNYISAQ